MTTNGLPPIEGMNGPDRLAIVKAFVRLREVMAGYQHTFQQLDPVDQRAWIAAIDDATAAQDFAAETRPPVRIAAFCCGFAAGHNYAMKYGALWRPPAGEAADHAD